MKIFVDMDGVIADFHASVFAVTGFNEAWPFGEYDINKVLNTNIWPLLERQGIMFWTDMPKTPEADELMELVSRYDYYIATSPTLDPQCAAGKLIWLRTHFPKAFKERRFFITPQKHLLAGDHNILIDDCDENITKWHANGGVGVLFPRPWNSHYMDTDSLQIIRRLVEILS